MKLNKRGTIRWDMVYISFPVTEKDIYKGKKTIDSEHKCPIGRAFRRAFKQAQSYAVFHTFLLVKTKDGLFRYDADPDTIRWYNEMYDTGISKPWICKYRLHDEINNRVV